MCTDMRFHASSSVRINHALTKSTRKQRAEEDTAAPAHGLVWCAMTFRIYQCAQLLRCHICAYNLERIHSHDIHESANAVQILKSPTSLYRG